MKKIMKKMSATLIALLATVAIVGTSIPSEAAAKAPKKISVATTSKTIDVKGKATVSVKSVTPTNASKSVSYKSSNTKVATVSSKGIVTGKKAGKTTITVTSKNNKKVKATVAITVKNLKPSSISMISKMEMKTGEKKTLKIAVKPVGVYCPVSYTSSNTKVATVSTTGVITAKTAGTVKITVKTKEKNSKNKYLTKTCTVTVKQRDRAEDDIEWQYMTSEEVFQAIEKNEKLTIIDLRPDSIPSETDTVVPDRGYAAGHIEGSIHIPAWPVADKASEDMLKTTYVMEQLKDNDGPVVFVCQSGASGAKRAISVMIESGISASRLYIQQGGGIDLLTNHKEKMVIGNEDFSGKYVISANDLKAKIDANETLILVDTRAIKDTTWTAKNAITMDWKEISNAPGSGVAGHCRTLAAEKVSEKLGEIGLGVNDEIILFSDAYASGGWGDDGRVAWQLMQCGYKNVKIVNGGLSAMKAAGIETQKGPSKRAAKEVKIEAVDTVTHDITTEELLEKVKANTVKVVDVRTNAEYDGAVLHGETSGGHIKGAIHIRFTDLFKYDGTLKSVAELTKMFEDAGLEKTDAIATYCTGGIRSAYMQLALEMCGFENSRNYAESAYRWSNTKDAGTGEYWTK